MLHTHLAPLAFSFALARPLHSSPLLHLFNNLCCSAFQSQLDHRNLISMSPVSITILSQLIINFSSDGPYLGTFLCVINSRRSSGFSSRITEFLHIRGTFSLCRDNWTLCPVALKTAFYSSSHSFNSSAYIVPPLPPFLTEAEYSFCVVMVPGHIATPL